MDQYYIYADVLLLQSLLI